MIYQDQQFKKTPTDYVSELAVILENLINQQEVDIQELDSYSCSRGYNTDFSRFAEPDDEDWDECEEYQAKAEKLHSCIEQDGWGEYLPIKDTRWWNEYLNNTPAYQRVQGLVLGLLENEF